MAPTVTAVAYGAEADQALATVVAAAQAGDPLAPVTVIVPTNYVGVAARRRLAATASRGIAGITFLTVLRLAELLGAPALAGAGRRPVSPPVLAAAVRRALGLQPGVFASVREHPATEEALVRVHRELRDLPPAALDRLAPASPRAADVVRLHRTVAADLAAGWYDEADLLAAASAAVGAGVPLVRALGTVVVYLPQELPSAASALVATLAEAMPVHVVAGLTGTVHADQAVRATSAAMGAPVHQPGPGDAVLPRRLEVVSTSDADEDARLAVRAVVDAARAGVALERIAVAYGPAEPYARLLAEHLDAAGVGRNGRASLRLRERVAGRVLLALLDLHDQGLARKAVFELLATAPLRYGGRLVPAAAWERRSREAGVVAGRQQWDGRLARLAATLEQEAVRLEADPDAGPASRSVEGRRRRAADALALRAFVLDLADRVDPARLPTRWSALATLVRRLLTDLLGGVDQRRRWPEAERRAADAVDALLERVSGLDAVDPAVTPAVFRRTVELELDADLGREGRLGEGVFVGPVGLALGQHPELLVVVGLAEGWFPTRPADDPLLPDRERRGIEGLALTADRTAREHRQLLAALAGAGRALLVVPRGDLRQSADRVPSRWLADLLAAAGDGHDARGEHHGRTDLAPAPLVRTVPSYAGGLAALEFAATGQEQRLRVLLDHVAAGGEAAAHPAVTADACLSRSARLVQARHSREFTPYDGDLGGLPVPSPFTTGFVTAPTRLEEWVACPHAYFLRRVLGVEAVDDPEELLTISPLDRGSLVHTVLDRFAREILARPEAERPCPDDAWTPADHARLLQLFDDEADQYEHRGLTGRALFWQRDRRRLARDLDRFLTDDSVRRRERASTPVASELRFGLPGADHDAVEVRLPDGRSVRFRGSADRVDRCADGTLVVIDYKTGKVDDKLTSDDPTAGGQRLQLPVYAVAARAALGLPDARVRAEYRIVNRKGRATQVGITVDDQALATFGHVLTVIADGMAAGSYAARPPEPKWAPWIECAYCDPDGLGTAAAHRQWQRKKQAPVLAAYLTLTGETT